MANTIFKLRRSSVGGKVPNTDVLSIGELAINLTDRKLFSSDGTNIFETGSNLTSLSVFSDIKIGNSSVNTSINSTSLSVKSIAANGSIGSAGQTLTSNGSGLYWAAGAGTGTVTSVDIGNGLFTSISTPESFVWGNTSNSIVWGSSADDLSWDTYQPITSTGTIFIAANTGLIADSTGLYVNAAYINTISSNLAHYIIANSGLISNSSGVFVKANTGIVANSSGLFVNTVRVYTRTLATNNQDIFTTTSEFTLGTAEVFYNGLRVSGSDYSEINTTAIQLGYGVPSGSVIEVTGWQGISPSPGNVSLVNSGNGIIGGPITSTGTLSILANTGLTVNSSGLFVNAAYIQSITQSLKVYDAANNQLYP